MLSSTTWTDNDILTIVVRKRSALWLTPVVPCPEDGAHNRFWETVASRCRVLFSWLRDFDWPFMEPTFDDPRFANNKKNSRGVT